MADLEMIKPRGVQNLINKFCYTIGILPTSYKQSLTYEEQILAIGNYLETVVYPAINNNAEALTELQGLFLELKNYVDNYFDNLDVQEEINNKIDDMVEQGTLQEIIADYLNSKAIFGFDTKQAMKTSTNLIDGSFAKTYGNTNYKTGDGHFYKIRNITNQDIVDDDNIIALANPDLIAEKIPDKGMEDLRDDVEILISKKENNLENKKFIFIGDSYNAGQSHDGAISKWGEDLAEKLGIENYYNLYSLGAGFYATGSGGKTFKNILEDNIATITDNNEIDYIVVGGGYNDAGYSSTYSQITTAIEEFCSYCKINFPKAKILIACFGYDDALNNRGITVRKQLYDYVLPAYKHNFTIDNQPIFIKNSEYILHNDAYFSSDYIHPNQAGIDKIVSCLYEYFTTGNINISSPIYSNSSITIDSTNHNFTEQLIDENKIRISLTNPQIVFSSPKTFTASNTPFKIGTHNSKILRASYTSLCALKNIGILLTVQSGGGYTNELINVDLIFAGNGDVLLQWKELSNGSWKSISGIIQITFENINAGYITPYFN